MRKSAKIAHARPTTTPIPGNLIHFLDGPPIGGTMSSNYKAASVHEHSMGGTGIGSFRPGATMGPSSTGIMEMLKSQSTHMEPPPFLPSTTLAGGVGGGFGTGGGFGSTGGFHTQRLAPWDEVKIIPQSPPAGKPVPKLDEWAPSNKHAPVARLVNRIRADMEGLPHQVAVVMDNEQEPASQPNKGEEIVHVQEPERFAFHHVTVPPPRLVKPPPGFYRQEYLLTPLERRQILQYEKDKSTADEYAGKERHRQMRMMALMQKRFPSGVDNVESSQTDGTIVYAATRYAEQQRQSAAQERATRKTDWIVRNSRSDVHLGYDFLRQIPADFKPPPGAPERKLWDTKRRVGPVLNTYERCFEMPDERAEHKTRHQANRAQNLRNNETFGKPYDIITGAMITLNPPNIEEKVFERRNHPSLNPGQPPPHITWVEPPLV